MTKAGLHNRHKSARDDNARQQCLNLSRSLRMYLVPVCHRIQWRNCTQCAENSSLAVIFIPAIASTRRRSWMANRPFSDTADTAARALKLDLLCT